MGSYVEPERWNEKSARADGEAKALRKKMAERESKAFVGKSAAMGDNPFFSSRSDAKAGGAAYDAVQNIDESMAEDAEQRTVDQYPKGTKYDGKTSRNKSGYGKTPAFANGGMVGDAGRKSYKK